MWPFTKKYSLQETGIFNGWTDRHSHILFGVDDGIRKLEDSLEVLALYEQLGVKALWLTPHIMEDCPNEPAHLKERFEELQEAYGKGKIELHLAAENMIDNLFVRRLERGELLTYGDEGNEVLVETSYVQAPYRFKGILQDIRQAGLYPVLAHPERYQYMDDDDYETLHEQGVRFQLNITSLAGAYGPAVKDRAEYLLQEGYYTYQGSDLHSIKSFKYAIEQKNVRKMAYKILNGQR